MSQLPHLLRSISLLAVLLLGGPALGAEEALARARSLMAAGDNEGAAEAATLAVRQSPDSGAALLVLGMAHFRGGRYPEALAAFRSARTAPEPPARGTLAFNEGAALFALARFTDAEAAFQEAGTQDERLRCLAALNAAQAALAAGALPRARTHLVAAEEMPGAAPLSKELAEVRTELDRREGEARAARAAELRARARSALLQGKFPEAISCYREARVDAGRRAADGAELAELGYGEGIALLRAGRAAEASELFRQAASLDATEADYPFMWGQAALEVDDPGTARRALERALALGLDQEDAGTARRLLDGLSLGLRRLGSGPSLSFELGSGYDSNVAQLSQARPDGISGETPEAAGDFWGTTSFELAYDKSFGPSWFAEVSYWLDQRAYADPAFDLYNLQTHLLGARGELTPGGPFRLGLAIEGEYQLAGLRDFGFFQRSFALEPHLAIDAGPRTATVLRLNLRAQDANPEEEHLDGRRLEVRVGQIWRSRSLRAEIGVRHRRDKLGTRTVDLGRLGRREQLTGRYLVPYGFTSNALVGDATLALGSRLRLGAGGSLERLRYREDNVVTAVGPLGRTFEGGRVRRQDDRLAAVVRLSFALTEVIDATLRYDLAVNRSNVQYTFDDKNYSKQVVSLSLGLSF